MNSVKPIQQATSTIPSISSLVTVIQHSSAPVPASVQTPAPAPSTMCERCGHLPPPPYAYGYGGYAPSFYPPPPVCNDNYRFYYLPTTNPYSYSNCCAPPLRNQCVCPINYYC